MRHQIKQTVLPHQHFEKSLCGVSAGGQKNKQTIGTFRILFGEGCRGRSAYHSKTLRKTCGNGNTIQLFFVVVLLHLGP